MQNLGSCAAAAAQPFKQHRIASHMQIIRPLSGGSSGNSSIKSMWFLNLEKSSESN